MKTLKRILTVVIISLFTVSVGAQTEAGKFLIGGISNMSLTSTTLKAKDDDDSEIYGTQLSLSLTPQGGYFVIDGLAVGLGLQLQYTKTKPDEGDDETQTGAVIQPLVRYYFGASKIKPYAQAGAGIGTVSIKYYDPFEDENVTDRSTIYLYEVRGGVGIFLNETVALDLSLVYSWMAVKPKEDNENNYRDITSTIGMGAGIVIVL
jgi:outer membrane protein